MADAGLVYRSGFAAGLTPDPDYTVSEWADAHRMLSQKASSEPGRWRTDRTPYLREIMDCLSPRSPVQRVIFQAGAQVGKALAVDTPIPTPAGWSTMGELNPGDKVFDADGNTTTVLGVSEVFVGHDCYRLTFSDGQTIVADAAHLWVVDDEPGKRLGEKKLTTEQIAKSFKIKGRNRYAIPVAGSLSLSDAELLVDPYVLGVWLGDGNSASAQITGHVDDIEEIAGYISAAGHCVEIRAIDARAENVRNIIIDRKEIGARYCERGHDTEISGRSERGSCRKCASERTMFYKSGRPRTEKIQRDLRLHERLSLLNLIKNKHLPAVYLRASKEQRLSLLQGLMDTDGHVGKTGRSEFCTVSDAIADGFMELCFSLGLKPSKYRTSANNAWRISFTCYSDLPCFRLKRKAKNLPSKNGRRVSETMRRRIVAVDKVESVPTRCILVDNPRHLFLAGKAMIPTHNTEAGNNWLGFIIHHAPGPVMMVQPTVDTVKRVSKQRIAPMIEESPVLRERIADNRARDSGNTQLVKEFQGGVLIMTGANSAVGLRSMPVRYLFCDEVDGYPADVDGEGDPVSLAERRTTTFARRKIYLSSTPTVKDVSRIEREYLASDQRRFFVPCPHCGEYQWLKWSQMKWVDDDPSTAAYACESCGTLIEERYKTEMLRKGEWRATADGENRVAGFHLSSLYSPAGWKSWAEIVAEFLQCKNDAPSLKTWVNTVLGETWEEEYSARIGAEGLAARVEFYEPGIAPGRVLAVTAGVDVQDNRLAVVIKGWGRDEESWTLDHQEIHGDPSRPEVWKQLDDLLLKPVEHELAEPLQIAGVCIDSGGHHTHEVYAYARERRAHRFMAIKGQSQRGKVAIGKPTKVDLNFRGRVMKSGAEVWPVGTDTIKSVIYGRLKLNEAGAGFYHFHAGLSADYFAQLTAEKQVTRYVKGFPIREWTKKAGARNEVLDCEVYAYAALQTLYMRYNRRTIWNQLEKALKLKPEKNAESEVQSRTNAKPVARVARPNFVNNW